MYCTEGRHGQLYYASTPLKTDWELAYITSGPVTVSFLSGRISLKQNNDRRLRQLKQDSPRPHTSGLKYGVRVRQKLQNLLLSKLPSSLNRAMTCIPHNIINKTGLSIDPFSCPYSGNVPQIYETHSQTTNFTFLNCYTTYFINFNQHYTICKFCTETPLADKWHMTNEPPCPVRYSFEQIISFFRKLPLPTLV